MNKEEAYKKILRCTNKALIIELGRYLDTVTYKGNEGNNNNYYYLK